MPPIIRELVSVFRVKRNNPAPVRCFFRAEAHIIEPALVEELSRTVGTGRPSQSRNRVDDGLQSIFRVLNFDESFFEGQVRSFKLDRNERNVAGRLDHLKISTIWNPRLRIRQAVGAKNLAVLRNQRFGPARAEPVAQGQVPSVIGPSWIIGNIRDNHSLFRKRGGAARTSVGTNRPRCNGRSKCVGNPRAGTRQQLLPVRIHQTNH